MILKEIWSLDNAQTRENSTRKEICLNGIWRFYPVLNNELTPEPRDEIYYSKVPGRWLNNLAYEVYELDTNNKLNAINTISGKIQPII